MFQPAPRSLSLVGVPQTMVAFGMKDFLNDFGCHFILYVLRVSRGVSMGSTCLLSVFQAITIHPGSSRLATFKLKALNYVGPLNILSWIILISPLHSRLVVFKRKAPKYIGPSSILCWVLHVLINTSFPIYAYSKWTNDTIMTKNMLKFCLNHYDYVLFSLYVALIFSHDVVCLGFMSLASGSMIFILYKHKQQVQHIHSNSMSSRYSAETRATKSIVVLVSIYVSFYSLSSIINAYVAHVGHASWWLVNTSAFILMCFPTVSPFVLMMSDSRVSSLCAIYSRTET
ncbi:vomeronasal type-1 receptor 2-like [Rhynchocyon petersi]